MKPFHTLGLALALFSSCEKDAYQPPPVSDVTVYVSGSSFDISKQRWVPTYWQDTVLHTMTDNPENAFGNAIFYSGNELYVAGQNSFSYPSRGVLWVNGAPSNLTPTGNYSIGDVKGLFVSGTDIFMAGSGPNASGDYPNGDTRAKWWKNGITNSLGYDSVYSEATDIAVSGTDVYICWWALKADGRFSARYTKNGETFLLDSTAFESYPKAISVSGSDVYIVGYTNDSAGLYSKGVYWKNGIMNKISSTDDEAYGSDIIVSGQDVYISGSEHVSGVNHPAYWKNGEKHLLGDGRNLPLTTGIALSGEDVFVSGLEYDSVRIIQAPIYWKNGTLQKLSAGVEFDGFRTTGIVVVKK